MATSYPKKKRSPQNINASPEEATTLQNQTASPIKRLAQTTENASISLSQQTHETTNYKFKQIALQLRDGL